MHHSQLKISRFKLFHNFNYFRAKLSKSTKLLVLVKANAYGHGDVEISQLLEEFGADYLGVAFPKEGIKLKIAGIKLPIVILTPGIDNFEEIILHGLEPSIINFEAAKTFVATISKLGLKSWPAHIKLDTGMSRVGFMMDEIEDLKKFLECNKSINVKSVFSHLSSAEYDNQDDFTKSQIEHYLSMYEEIASVLPERPMRHILNSSGIDRFTEYQFDMVRLGIGIYGSTYVNGNDSLLPVASLEAPVVQIKNLKDVSVGYGRHGVVGDEEKTIATIPLGYADGVNRHLGRGNACFAINGQLAPTIGNICMDMFMLDITGIDAKVGDTVTVFGEKPLALDLAKILGTITYEIFTSVSSRVTRVVSE